MKNTASLLNHSKLKTMALKAASVSPLLKLMQEDSLRGKDLLGIAGLSKAEMTLILESAELLKLHAKDETQLKLCKGKTLAMLFEKPSLRTRVTFEVGMNQLGGHAIFIEGPIGQREPIKDMACNFERWVDGIMARTFKQSTVNELAEHGSIPVINGLSDEEHPCQTLDTSCILAWLKENYNVPVIAYCADVGQNEDLEAAKEKALKHGAEKCIIDDLKKQFAEEYIFEAIKADALYESEYLMGTALARPCIAAGMVEAALKEGCDAIAHGSTGKGNDQVRFELAVKSLAPQLEIIAPWRIWSFNGRQDLFEYAEKHSIPLPVTKEKPYSMDANLMHISYEGGILEDPWLEPPADMFLWTKAPEQAPDTAEYLTVEFKSGVPIALNGELLPALELIQKVNEIAALHGIGRVDLVENRYIGIKSRGVYETPGLTVLMQAHLAVQSLTLDKELSHWKQELSLKFSELTYNGYWFAPEMKILKSTLSEIQSTVSGIAKLKLYKGKASVVGRQAEKSLYKHKLSSFDDMTSFSPKDSGGFININALRLSNWSQTHESIKKSIQAGA
ncbi:MAG: argininosuccinate synthase [Candidatus Obscuribacterales bacterium]|nr:argininosuccinate synthase [Candidatus Obscuribacterales bacterium]